MTHTEHSHHRNQETGFAANVVSHPELGSIGFPYGVAGDPANDFAGGYGVAHVDAKHPAI